MGIELWYIYICLNVWDRIDKKDKWNLLQSNKRAGPAIAIRSRPAKIV